MTQPAGGTAPRPLIHQHGVRLSALARGRPTQWRSLDIVTGAVLGVAFGVAFWGFDSFVYTPLSTALSFLPPLKELLLGVWLLPCVAGMLIIRRPGAALLVEMVAASIEALLGNYWGLTVLISGLLQALGVELVAAVLRWRRFDLTMAVLGGIMAAVLEILAYEWWFMVPEYSWTWKLLYLAAGIRFRGGEQREVVVPAECIVQSVLIVVNVPGKMRIHVHVAFHIHSPFAV